MSIFDLFGSPKMLIVDVLNLIYRGFHGAHHLNTTAVVSHIYGPLNILMSQRKQFDGAEIHFVMDGHPKHRYEAFPGYKGERVKGDDDASIVKEAIQMLRMVPGYWYEHPDAEADDIAATLVSENPEAEIRVISSDKDLWAFVSQNVAVIGNKGAVFTPQVVQEKLGVPPNKVPIHKIFFGDDSDKIPPVGGRIRKAKLIPLLMAASSVDQVYEMLDGEHGLSKNEVTKLRDCREQAVLNAKIVPLVYDVSYTKETLKGDQLALVEFLKERDCPSLVMKTEVLFDGKLPPIEAKPTDLSGLFD